MNAHAIVIREYGSSEVLACEDVDVAEPTIGELLIRQTGIGVNFHDVYVRSGLYKTLPLPGVPGCEAVGIVEGVGSGVEGFTIGDKIAYVTGSYGAYASHRLLDAELALKVPDDVSDALVATNLLRAMTVDMLITKVAQVKAGDTILVQAAAGGVGRLLCQWASHIGANVIGTVGSATKAQQATRAGCEHPILYREVEFVEAVREITDGRGVDYAFDSVGKDTFYGSLDTLKPTGHLINFGQSSGPVKPLEMPQLASKSLTVSRPILFHYLAKPSAYEAMGRAVFEAFSNGFLSVEEPQVIPLEEASRAHDVLESRNGGGALVLEP
ncbi:Quinone oxidoreductase 1 [Roseovarius albus]|uniref:Quinone oxidoreductase 1 n=1 Tax=Roseovarius albus TaxID=1247867 RepID=A0A1X6Y7J8_9RHOB|nr:quinone oxidoreductase [Roseovarius albus]SLN13050.1 Quinone oxidoreductase 1 [Roseovarius albus]